MRRQFDILVLEAEGKGFVPPVEDPALGYFYAEDFSQTLEKFDAEWILMISPGCTFDREFLNEMANLCDSFSFADALAPRVLCKGKTVSSGFVLDFPRGIVEEFRVNAPNEIREVASLSPVCGIYSLRLLQALRGIDRALTSDAKFFDLGMRALHLGAHIFAVPRLGIECAKLPDRGQTFAKDFACACYKNFDIVPFLKFALRHPLSAAAALRRHKELDRQSLEVTELSRLSEETRGKIRA